MKKIGILGGMGPLATADLYKKIISMTKAQKDQDHIEVVIYSNSQIPDRTDYILNGGEDPREELIESAKVLEKAGCDFILIPCNTAHYFYEDIQKSINIPILNMLELTVKHTIKKYGKNVTVGLLSSDGTYNSKIYDKYFDAAGVKLLKPQVNKPLIREFIYECIKGGNIDIGTEGFYTTIEELKQLGAEVFLLGCTELSAAAEIFELKGEYIDPLVIIAEEAILRAGAELKGGME